MVLTYLHFRILKISDWQVFPSARAPEAPGGAFRAPMPQVRAMPLWRLPGQAMTLSQPWKVWANCAWCVIIHIIVVVVIVIVVVVVMMMMMMNLRITFMGLANVTIDIEWNWRTCWEWLWGLWQRLWLWPQHRHCWCSASESPPGAHQCAAGQCWACPISHTQNKANQHSLPNLTINIHELMDLGLSSCAHKRWETDQPNHCLYSSSPKITVSVNLIDSPFRYLQKIKVFQAHNNRTQQPASCGWLKENNRPCTWVSYARQFAALDWSDFVPHNHNEQNRQC